MRIESLTRKKYARKILLRKLAWVPVLSISVYVGSYYYVYKEYKEVNQHVQNLESQLVDEKKLNLDIEETKEFKKNQEKILHDFSVKSILYSKFLKYLSDNIPVTTWVYELNEIKKEDISEDKSSNTNGVKESSGVSNQDNTQNSENSNAETTSGNNESIDSNGNGNVDDKSDVVSDDDYIQLELGKRLLSIRGASTSSSDIGLLKIRIENYPDVERVDLVEMQQTVTQAGLLYVYEMKVVLKESSDQNEG